VYHRLTEISYTMFEELFRVPDLLLFSRYHALEFSNIWYRRERRSEQQSQVITHLLAPFRDYGGTRAINLCKLFLQSENFRTEDLVELFVVPQLKENHDSLYAMVVQLIRQHFQKVFSHELLVEISFEVLSDLLSERKSFDLKVCARNVLAFAELWLAHKTDREVYRDEVQSLLEKFRSFYEAFYLSGGRQP